MNKSIIAIVLSLLSTYSANAEELSTEKTAVIACWSIYSTLGIIGREDGQTLVEELFKDQARSAWRIGSEKFGIQFFDPLYTTVRDSMLESYRSGATTYDDLMQNSFSCNAILFNT